MMTLDQIMEADVFVLMAAVEDLGCEHETTEDGETYAVSLSKDGKHLLTSTAQTEWLAWAGAVTGLMGLVQGESE